MFSNSDDIKCTYHFFQETTMLQYASGLKSYEKENVKDFPIKMIVDKQSNIRNKIEGAEKDAIQLKDEI